MPYPCKQKETGLASGLLCVCVLNNYGLTVRKNCMPVVLLNVMGDVAPGTVVHGPVIAGADCSWPAFHCTVTLLPVRLMVSLGAAVVLVAIWILSIH